MLAIVGVTRLSSPLELYGKEVRKRVRYSHSFTDTIDARKESRNHEKRTESLADATAGGGTGRGTGGATKGAKTVERWGSTRGGGGEFCDRKFRATKVSDDRVFQTLQTRRRNDTSDLRDRQFGARCYRNQIQC